MILCFPLAVSDLTRAEKFVKGIKHFGPYNTEKALIVPTPSFMASAESRKLVFDLANTFGGTGENGRAVIKELPNDPDGGWPKAPNVHFQFIVEYIMNIFPNEPWMIIESDGTPTQKNWVTQINQEYAINGNPFTGAVEPSRMIHHFPGAKGRQQVVEGEHMVGGCGVYPPRYSHGVGIGGSPRVVWNFPDSRIPYDIRCQYDHAPCSPSRIMLHKPRTVKWTPADGESGKCYTVEDEAGQPDEFGNTSAGLVDLEGICYVHGCKDGSLLDILLAQSPAEPAPAAIPATLERPDRDSGESPSFDSESPQINFSHINAANVNFDASSILARWKEKNPDLDEGIFWDALADQLRKTEVELLNPSPPQLTEKVSKSRYAPILDAIKNSEKGRVRIQSLSEATGIPLNKLKAMSKEDDSPFRVIAFGFVELRKPQPA